MVKTEPSRSPYGKSTLCWRVDVSLPVIGTRMCDTSNLACSEIFGICTDKCELLLFQGTKFHSKVKVWRFRAHK